MLLNRCTDPTVYRKPLCQCTKKLCGKLTYCIELQSEHRPHSRPIFVYHIYRTHIIPYSAIYCMQVDGLDINGSDSLLLVLLLAVIHHVPDRFQLTQIDLQPNYKKQRRTYLQGSVKYKLEIQCHMSYPMTYLLNKINHVSM